MPEGFQPGHIFPILFVAIPFGIIGLGLVGYIGIVTWKMLVSFWKADIFQ